MRTCVGCRRQATQDELVRVVRGPDGALEVGRALPGRGAWFCAESAKCVDLAIKRKTIPKALRGPVEVAELHNLRAVLLERARMEGRGSMPRPERV